MSNIVYIPCLIHSFVIDYATYVLSCIQEVREWGPAYVSYSSACRVPWLRFSVILIWCLWVGFQVWWTGLLNMLQYVANAENIIIYILCHIVATNFSSKYEQLCLHIIGIGMVRVCGSLLFPHIGLLCYHSSSNFVVQSLKLATPKSFFMDCLLCELVKSLKMHLMLFIQHNWYDSVDYIVPGVSLYIRHFWNIYIYIFECVNTCLQKILTIYWRSAIALINKYFIFLVIVCHESVHLDFILLMNFIDNVYNVCVHHDFSFVRWHWTLFQYCLSRATANIWPYLRFSWICGGCLICGWWYCRFWELLPCRFLCFHCQVYIFLWLNHCRWIGHFRLLWIHHGVIM